MSRVTTWTEKTTFDGTESLAVDDGTNVRVLASNLVVPIASGGTATTQNFSLDPAVNTIDSSAYRCINITAGDSLFPNKIGAASKPVGTDYTNPSSWADDTGYVTGSASVASINGGYDNVNNQQAGIIGGGGHHYIQYHVNGHSLIVGGSYNWISSYRSAIFGGTDNRLDGNFGFSAVLSGFTNRITGTSSYSVIIGGNNNTNSSTSDYNLQFGDTNTMSSTAFLGVQMGRDHTMSAASRSIQIGGDANGRTSGINGAAISGDNNTQTANRSACITGSSCNDNGNVGAVLFGDNARGINSANSLIQGGGTLTVNGDSQSFRAIQNGLTTSATDVQPASSEFIELDDTRETVVTGRVRVTAWNVTTSEEAGWSLDFVAFWDGTTDRINGSTTDVALTAIYNPGAIDAPLLALNTGSMRIRFQGMAGETIRYVADYDCVMTAV
ncbi:MAG: hypothetical protein KJN62_02290 [Deltaproteobacteria bacterium]|nr:hypothetical protein [Deltaproteobacteria bacterium]